MTTLYIDVSFHDRNRRGQPLDWHQIRDATSPVMMARATYGDPSGWNRPSPYFDEFQTGANDAGFVARGAWHNLIHGDAASISRQVDWIRATRDRHGCHWVMADIEPYPELVSNGLWPRWDDVQRFHDVWYARESMPMAWYIPRWFWADRGGGLPSLGQPGLNLLRGPLVQSHYAGGDGTATQIYANAGGDTGTGWDDSFSGRLPDIWQFSSGANVPGASDNTCVNAFRGDLSQLVALVTGGQQDMTPQESAQLNALYQLLVPDPPLRVQGDWTYTRPDGRSVPINPIYNAIDRIAELVEKVAERVDVDTTELAAIKEAARAGAETGTLASAAQLAAAVAAELRDATQLTPDQAQAAAERAVRRVLGAVDGATPPAAAGSADTE